MPDCSHCDVYPTDTVQWFLCVIDCELDDNGTIVSSNSIPLTGSPKTNFISNANDAATKSSDAQQDDFFSGLTPSLISKPGGTNWQQWYEDMADRAFEIVTSSSPTTAEKQEALDRLYTIEQKVSDYKTAYT